MNDFGKLKRVPLRELWIHEAEDFTKWLSKEENLALLSEEIGIDIKHIESESRVGSFKVDIFAEEENTGRRIIIENQLEQTDHDHLGKLMTYASGLDAEIIVWVSKDIREEHRQALDWLNEHSDESINIFGVKIEAWKIDDSKPAPKFEITSRPNYWTKAAKTTASQKGMGQAATYQLDFWNNFKQHAEAHTTGFSFRQPRPQHWYDIAIGSSLGHISFTLNTRTNELTAKIYIWRSKELFDYLHEKKDVVEKAADEELYWDRKAEDVLASEIGIKKTFESIGQEDADQTAVFEWMCDQAGRLRNAFAARMKDFSSR